MGKHTAPSEDAYVLVKVRADQVGAFRNYIHDNPLHEGDIPFYADGRTAYYSAATRDAAIAKYDRLDTVYQTTINNAKEYAKKLRRASLR